MGALSDIIKWAEKVKQAYAEKKEKLAKLQKEAKEKVPFKVQTDLEQLIAKTNKIAKKELEEWKTSFDGKQEERFAKQEER
eukprot:4875469-Ditylum_brightwellii.AAC.1